MTYLNFTCLLLTTVSLSLFTAVIPAAANDSSAIPVETVAPLESATGNVRDLGTIAPTNEGVWDWKKTENSGTNNTDTNLKLRELSKPNSEEVGNRNNAAPNAESWGNTGERRRKGPTIELTEF